MNLQVGDRVVWTLFPSYGEGTVVVEVIEGWGAGIRFSGYNDYLSDTDCHSVETKDLVKVPS